LGVLFALQGTLTITSLCSVPFFLLAHFIPHVSLDIWLVAYTWFTLCVHYFWMRVSVIVHLVSCSFNRRTIDALNLQTRRLRVGTRVRQFMVCLLQTHGLAAPLSERHGEARITFLCSHRYVNLLSRVGWHHRYDAGIFLRHRPRLFATRRRLSLPRSN
jgi:hypothetical protein